MSSTSVFAEVEFRGEPTIIAKGISFEHENRKVDKLSLEIRSGDIFGIVGSYIPESLKLFRILSGNEKPSDGTITYRPYGDLDKARKLGRIGVYTRGSSLLPELTIHNNFKLIASSQKSIDPDRRIAEILSIFDLSSFSEKKIRSVPENVSRKATAAAIFVNSPDFLFFEDFTLELDRSASNAVLNFLRSEAGLGKCICILTDEPESACNRVIVLRGEEDPLLGPTGAIIESALGTDRVEVKVKGISPTEAENILTPIEGTWMFEAEDEAVLYVNNRENELDHLFRNLSMANIQVLRIRAKRGSLESLVSRMYRGGRK